ncbi:MAG: type II toxin-antitoxin system RelE/ParE family toxin [Myxococcaceae bacterium]|nr:type II toxin-antitoxin system RelE/ParE family toxin [Myxococcaceae bacterium]
MPALRLTRAARRDLVDIGAFTLDRWGDAQLEKYLRQLDARLHAIARHPEHGRPCDEVRPGLMKVREGRHVIFYRSKNQRVEVVRVLHASMDPSRHL